MNQKSKSMDTTGVVEEEDIEVVLSYISLIAMKFILSLVRYFNRTAELDLKH